MRKCYEVALFFSFFLILSFNLIMSSSNDLANMEVGQDQSFTLQAIDECKTHLCFEFISHDILSILYPYSCKTHKISSKLGFTGFLIESK